MSPQGPSRVRIQASIAASPLPIEPSRPLVYLAQFSVPTAGPTEPTVLAPSWLQPVLFSSSARLFLSFCVTSWLYDAAAGCLRGSFTLQPLPVVMPYFPWGDSACDRTGRDPSWNRQVHKSPSKASSHWTRQPADLICKGKERLWAFPGRNPAANSLSVQYILAAWFLIQLPGCERFFVHVHVHVSLHVFGGKKRSL